MTARALGASLFSIVLLGVAGCAGTGGQHSIGYEPQAGQTRQTYGDSRTFPVPPEIQDNVEFWRNVYGVWGRGEVAIHDSDHLGVIYEVVKLPGSIQNSFTASQSDYVESRKRYYSSLLSGLEERTRSSQRLARNEQEILSKLKRAGGTSALYGAADRVRAQRGLKERFHRGIEISGRYDRIFREIMRSHGVPEDLAYLPHVESSFQVNARSSVGAGGVWQFMPSTGRHYMTVDSKIDERFDPILAANGAARYLSQAYGKLGSWPLAITSYNHGQGGMAKAKAQYGNDIGRIVREYQGQYFGFASRNFYAEFVAAREVAKHADRYFPEGIRYEEPWSHDRLVLRNSVPAHHLVRHYGISRRDLAQLNMHVRDAVLDGKSDLPAGCTLWLPSGTTRRIASQPAPVSRPVVVASVSKPARSSSSDRTRVAVAKASSRTKTVSRPAKVKVAKAAARYHVVKPQETLYRVALQNGITVAQLRKLNKMQPDDTNIRPGQRLIVGI